MGQQMRQQNGTAKWDSKGDRHLYARATCCKASMLHTKNDKTKLKLGKLKRSWRGVEKELERKEERSDWTLKYSRRIGGVERQKNPQPLERNCG